MENNKVGKWIRTGSGSLIDTYRCSCCRSTPPTKKVGITWGWNFTKVCPNCHAQMENGISDLEN